MEEHNKYLQLLGEFLNRVPLEGREVAAFTELINYMKNLKPQLDAN